MIRIPPRRRRTVTNDEHSLWRTVMRDTEPLPGRELDGEPEPRFAPDCRAGPSSVSKHHGAVQGRPCRFSREPIPCPS